MENPTSGYWLVRRVQKGSQIPRDWLLGEEESIHWAGNPLVPICGRQYFHTWRSTRNPYIQIPNPSPLYSGGLNDKNPNRVLVWAILTTATWKSYGKSIGND